MHNKLSSPFEQLEQETYQTDSKAMEQTAHWLTEWLDREPWQRRVVVSKGVAVEVEEEGS